MLEVVVVVPAPPVLPLVVVVVPFVVPLPSLPQANGTAKAKMLAPQISRTAFMLGG